MDERLQLSDPDPSVRESAAENLSYLGEEAAPAAVELLRACEDEVESVQQWAVAALEGMGAPPSDCVDEIISVAQRQQPLSAYWAITLLGRSGGAALRGEPDLIAILAEASDDALQERAAWALGRIHADSTEAIAALNEASTSDRPRLSQLAKDSLEQIGA